MSDFHEDLSLFLKEKEKKEENLEARLLKVFSETEAKELGLPLSVYPHMLRGLPRFYDRENPAKSLVKPAFKNLNSLKRHWIEKAIFSLYQDVQIPASTLSLFTWVMNDGMGDYYAQKEAEEIIKGRFPQVTIQRLSFLPRETALEPPHYCIYYDKGEDLTWEKIEGFLPLLKTSQLVLQMPTYFPDTPKLLEKIQDYKPPKYELLGEYGFVDSKWCHPGTGYRSLGLHFLEKGLLIQEIAPKDLSRLPKELKEILFKEGIATYQEKIALNAGYLSSVEGAFAALIALLKKREKDPKPMDLVLANFSCMLGALEKYIEKDGAYPLLQKFGIKEVEIYYEGSLCKMNVQAEGKRLRLIQAKNLTPSDFGSLFYHSQDFVICRGDRSFSEAVSLKKVFFYDPPYHSKNFLKDLGALAENRIGRGKGAAEYIRLFYHLLPAKPDSGDRFVEEDFFFERNFSIQEIGERMGELLSSPDTINDLQKLNSILIADYSANDYLCQLVARSLLHYYHPEMLRIEESLVREFLEDKITFSVMITELRDYLTPFRNVGQYPS